MKHIKRNIVRSLRFNWNDSEARVVLDKVIKNMQKNVKRKIISRKNIIRKYKYFVISKI